MLKKAMGLVLLMFAVAGCVNRDEIYANPPAELVAYVDQIMPAATEFVTTHEALALQHGQPLTSAQLKIAKKVGLQHAEKVRVYYVDKLPFPQDPELAALAKEYGYSSPMMAAYTYGHGIWIKHAEKQNTELLAHELIHVRQAEQLGLDEQTKQYLMQLFIYGYRNAPMEVEAYNQAPNYL
ncbi:DUF4157 domain-containing protein [Motilimonas sp. KMU-193]|uniref:eCIS core domain-containing protein n=1 Tax=Motilimonas sp. KMU-193 TaxID=3388668 RepID=UPI00396B1AB6